MDIEGDGLLDQLTKFHCLAFKSYLGDKFYVFCDVGQLSEDFMKERVGVRFFEMSRLLGFIKSGMISELVCHNQIGYDLPAMQKILDIPYSIKPDSFHGKDIKITDSLVMSRVLNPDRQLPPGCPTHVLNAETGKKKPIGVHGLASWGYRVANMKPDVDDWRTQPLEVYCNRVIEDVIINELTYTALLKEKADVAIPNGGKAGSWEGPLDMAHKVYHLMREQEDEGAVFDVDGAEKLIVYIDKEMKAIESVVEPRLGSRDLPPAKQPNFPQKPWNKAFDYAHPWTAGGKLKKPVSDYLSLIGVKDGEDYILSLGGDIETRVKKDPTILSSSSLSFCRKYGITDVDEAFKEVLRVESGGSVERLSEPIRMANQDSIKNFFINSAGWQPTLWRTKNLLVDMKTKQKYSEEDQDKKIKKYIEDIQKSPYKKLILVLLGYKKEPDYSSTAFYNIVKRRGRAIPSSPQLKDTRGNLCPNLERLEAETAKLIVKWLSLRNRRTTIKSFDKNTGWLNNSRLLRDGRLPTASTGLTNTLRQKHHVVCNIPKPDDSVILGKEVRGLFIAPEGYCCVGTDCCGIEGRAMGEAAWAFDGGSYAKEILDGDIHSKNAKAFTKAVGREVGRGEGKGPFYAGIYGCQDQKMAQLLGVDPSIGGRVIEALWSVAPGLKKCKEALEQYWLASGKKYIMAINGAKIFTRSKHSLLNALLQSTDALLMDWACCWIDKEIKARNLDAKRWIYYHDEVNFYSKITDLDLSYYPLKDKPGEFRSGVQYSKPKIFRGGITLHSEPKKEDLLPTDQWVQGYSEVGEICVNGMKKAGEFFNFRVPLDGQYILGGSWGETH